MEIFRLPMREVAARVLMDSGESLEGVLYVVAEGPDGHPGRLVDRLNDPTEEFVPMSWKGDSVLINKSGMLTVRLKESGFDEVPDAGEQPEHTVPVRVTLAGGHGLLGRFFVSMPPERARVLDYLNAAPRFVPLLGEQNVTLVQRRYIHNVRTLADE